jgi:hypothetical protein
MPSAFVFGARCCAEAFAALPALPHRARSYFRSVIFLVRLSSFDASRAK